MDNKKVRKSLKEQSLGRANVMGFSHLAKANVGDDGVPKKVKVKHAELFSQTSTKKNARRPNKRDKGRASETKDKKIRNISQKSREGAAGGRLG
tara:strand:+ start:4296 stop:4577 length:282 start_codon:yes stop_codon:yes gene_type:complete